MSGATSFHASTACGLTARILLLPFGLCCRVGEGVNTTANNNVSLMFKCYKAVMQHIGMLRQLQGCKLCNCPSASVMQTPSVKGSGVLAE